jgi:hypothetical protein
MVKAVTGRSFSTTVWAETGMTSTIQGDASSWRRNRVGHALRRRSGAICGGVGLARGTGLTLCRGLSSRLSRCGVRVHRGDTEVDQPGVRRERLGDFVQQVGPDVPIAIDPANDGDLRQQRVADLFLAALVGEESLEPPVLAPGLLQPGLEHVELPEIVEIDHPEAGHHADPRADRRHEERILHFGGQLAQSAQAIEQALERVAAALALLAGP